MMDFETFKALVAEKFDKNADELTADTTILGDLGADSLDIVDLLMTLEEDYNVIIPDDEVTELKTLGDVFKYFQ